MVTGVGGVTLGREHWLERTARWCGVLTQPIAFLGVFGMLVVSGVTVVDVVLRYGFSSGIVALNEITAMAFTVAVAACVPSGMARGVNLSVDVLEGMLGPRTTALLKAVGATLLFAFLAILAWQLTLYATSLIDDRRTTQMLHMPLVPFVGSAAILLGLGSAVQLVMAANNWRMAGIVSSIPGPRARTALVLEITIAIFGLGIVGVAVLAVVDFSHVQNWAQTNATVAVFGALLLMWVFLLCLIPLAAVLGLVGLIGCALFIGVNPSYSAMVTETLGFLSNYQVAALPLFLMMGSFAAVAGVAEDVYRLAQALLGSFRGGLAMATIGGCAGFGAVTGSSLATVATFGQVALPQMEARGYAPRLSVGCVAAGGTLGALIPPSGPLILFALLTEASIGQLFVAAVIPGLIAVAFYLVAIAITVRLEPQLVPPATPRAPGELIQAIQHSGFVIVLFGTVIGGMYTGVFTATEAAAVGAFGSFLVALVRGRLQPRVFLQVMAETTASTAMIYTLIFGVLTFSFFVVVTALPQKLISMVGGLDVAPIVIIILILAVYLFLGCVMDSITVMVITVPVVTPIILHLGYDLVWWGVINLIVVETGLITPPFGLHLFLLRSLSPGTPLGTIYRGVAPYCVADFVKLSLLVFFPALALWLPSTMFK